jgi:hypothetical protein
MKETLRHTEAFEYYYSLGAGRSITEVARQHNAGRASVAKWSKAFSWQERVEQRDIENAKRLEKRTNDTVVAAKADYRKIVRAAIKHWVERFKQGGIDIRDTRDLERLVKLDLLLMGEATDRPELRDAHESEVIRKLFAENPELINILFRAEGGAGQGGEGAPPSVGEVR